LHGYIKKHGGPFGSWQTRYAKLYPNRLELHPESGKPDLIFMDNIEEVNPDLVPIKGEQCIVLRPRGHKPSSIVLTNPVSSSPYIYLPRLFLAAHLFFFYANVFFVATTASA
jgi:beta-adrenergic-receptor kinase